MSHLWSGVVSSLILPLTPFLLQWEQGNRKKKKAEEIIKHIYSDLLNERESDESLRQSHLSVQEPSGREGRSSEGGHRRQ